MQAIKSQCKIYLINRLNYIVEHLRDIFKRMDKENQLKEVQISLEEEKDKCFNELNEILPQLNGEEIVLYGEYYVKKCNQCNENECDENKL